MPASLSTIADALKRTALFAALAEDELASLAARGLSRNYCKNQLLFSEGDPCAGLYVIASGRVRIFKAAPNGREQVLSIEGSGSSIAELPVFDGGCYPASAAALENSELIFVSRDDFQSLCLKHPEVSLKVLQVVGSRLRRLVGIIEELSFTTVRNRLISYLLRMAKTEAQPTPKGLTFTIEGNQQLLAAEIGTVRELVSRNLLRLQAERLIEINGREITIIDLQGLKRAGLLALKNQITTGVT